jgi:hypothetical protein
VRRFDRLQQTVSDPDSHHPNRVRLCSVRSVGTAISRPKAREHRAITGRPLPASLVHRRPRLPRTAAMASPLDRLGIEPERGVVDEHAPADLSQIHSSLAAVDERVEAATTTCEPSPPATASVSAPRSTAHEREPRGPRRASARSLPHAQAAGRSRIPTVAAYSSKSTFDSTGSWPSAPRSSGAGTIATSRACRSGRRRPAAHRQSRRAIQGGLWLPAAQVVLDPRQAIHPRTDHLRDLRPGLPIPGRRQQQGR